jgi:putative ABC transport system substrate-binding protein
MSYGADLADQYRKSAHYVDKILKGTKPGDPLQRQRSLNSSLTKAAKQIGLTIPPDV